MPLRNSGVERLWRHSSTGGSTGGATSVKRTCGSEGSVPAETSASTFVRPSCTSDVRTLATDRPSRSTSVTSEDGPVFGVAT